MSPRPQSPLTFEFVLLGLLEQRPMHGYDLFKALDRLEGVGLVWRVKQSRLYALLDRLEGEGLLSGKVVPSQNRPDRREYQLTEEGHARFETWRASPVGHLRDVRQEFLARLYFALQAGQDSARSLVSAQRDCCRRWMDEMAAQAVLLGEDRLYEILVLRYRISQAGALLEWLDVCERQI
ncbi:MAG: PadR family transcriptional regulator [Anaerolineaceae bacterium]|nr:PadR family transcriptional regulator [Anaerolineaceae bacterium]